MAIVFKVCFETQQHKFKLSFLTLTPHLFDLKSILCLLLCQVPAQGVGISTAAVRVKYKCSNRPGGGISADTACVFVSTCVQVSIGIPWRGQSWPGLYMPDLRFFLPLNVFLTAHPVSGKDRNSPQYVFVIPHIVCYKVFMFKYFYWNCTGGALFCFVL